MYVAYIQDLCLLKSKKNIFRVYSLSVALFGHFKGYYF